MQAELSAPVDNNKGRKDAYAHIPLYLHVSALLTSYPSHSQYP